MPISVNTVAYGTVLVVAIALLAIGTPGERSSALQLRLADEKPVTPPYAMALNAQLAADKHASGPNAPAAIAQAGGVTLRSVGFDFPTSDTIFPPGPGSELVSNNCQSCHSPGMIMTQPALTGAEWTGEVNKMLHTYKAPIPEEDVAGIAAYLTSLKTPP